MSSSFTTCSILTSLNFLLSQLTGTTGLQLLSLQNINIFYKKSNTLIVSFSLFIIILQSEASSTDGPGEPGRLKQETRLVEQLSAQARPEQTTAMEVRDSVEQLRQQTQTDKVRRAVGVCWNVCGCKVSIYF